MKDFNEIHTVLIQALSKFFSDPSEIPLMISSHLPTVIQDCLLEAAEGFSIPHKIWQFIVLSTYNSSHFYQNLSLLANTIPLLYADTIAYQGRLFYEDTAPAQHHDILLPHYILLPTQAFLFDTDGSAMYCIHDTAAVEHLRFKFTQEFLLADPYLIHDVSGSLPTSVLAQVGGIPSLDTKLCYFSESSLLAFVRNTDTSSDSRKELLHTLYQRCADGAPVRLIDENLLSVAANSSLYITSDRHLLIQNCTFAGIHQYNLCDKDIADALLQYLSVLGNSPLLHTRQYTLDFIQCCFPLISENDKKNSP